MNSQYLVKCSLVAQTTEVWLTLMNGEQIPQTPI